MITEIKASEYGLEEVKAKQIKEVFIPMLDKMESLEKDYNEIIKLEMSEDTCVKAKDLRLQYRNVRTGTAKIHKELKHFYLQGGRFVDGLKNAQLMACQSNEEKLSNIENHYVNIEKEKIAKLQEKRESELQKYDVDYIPADLGEMETKVWGNYISGVKANHEVRIKAEEEAEQERIEEERTKELHQIRNEKIMPYYQWWNEDLKGYNLGTLSEKEFDTVMDDLIKEKTDYDKKQEEVRLTNQKLVAEAKVAQKKRQLLVNELKEKAAAEEQQRLSKESGIQDDLNKSDRLKVLDLCADLDTLKTKYVFKSAKNKRMYNATGDLLDKIIAYISK